MGVANAIFMTVLQMPYTPLVSVAVAITNLLPTYRDPASGQKIYTSGMTFYL